MRPLSLRFVALALVNAACSTSSSGTGSGDGGTSTGTGPGTGSTPPVVQELAEKEPNDGPDRTGMQDIGAFTDAKTIVIKGNLKSGGSDGQAYTGDFDGFAFSVAAAGGQLAVKVEWTGSADVDALLYDEKLTPLSGDNTTAKPIDQKGAIPAGSYAVVLYSKDAATDWTLTMTYTKPQAGSGGSCASPLQADLGTSGCKFTMNEPANGEAITLPYTFGWRSDGCETPGRVHIFGNPPTPENSFSYQYTRGGQQSLFNVLATRQITETDLAALTSDNGVYHWQLESFHKALSEGRTFTIGPKTCK